MKTIKNDFVISLDDRWRLICDDLQYMVQQRTTSNGKLTWISYSFVATHKNILYQVFKSHDIQLTDEAKSKIDALPETFQEFWKEFSESSN